MNEYKTGAVRDTGGKGRMDLLPMCALIRISKHMEDAIVPDPETGVPHYPERNWEKGIPMHSMIDSAFRHLAKYVDGWTDEDHLCAAATNLLMAMWTEEKKPDMQDIPTRMDDYMDAYMDGIKSILKANNACVLEANDALCSSYHVENGVPVCWGTKNMEKCYCSGIKSECTHYPEKRNE